MNRSWPLAAALLVLLQGQAAVHAAELQVLSSNALTGVLGELVPAFEQASGNTLVVRFDTTQALTEGVSRGEEFDVAILTHAAAQSLAASGKCSSGTDIARSGLGVAVRAGTPKPDIATLAAFRQSLRAAKSVGFSSTGASGLYVEQMLQRIGMASTVNAKVQRYPSDQLARRLADGEVELVIQQISEIHVMQGSAYAGPLPQAVQNETVFTASVGAGAHSPAAAQALVAFLSAPAAAAVIRAQWMLPP
jgi:molybdate transport system substrate-binding protein